jgi:hypothetical protein
MNVVGIVILASPPRDPIQSKRHNGRRLRALHTYSATTPPPQSSKVCGGVVDGISSTTVWCLWWRVSASRASPTCARWKKIGKRSSQTRARKYYKELRRQQLKQFPVEPHAAPASLLIYLGACVLENAPGFPKPDGPIARSTHVTRAAGLVCMVVVQRVHATHIAHAWPLCVLPP